MAKWTLGGVEVPRGVRTTFLVASTPIEVVSCPDGVTEWAPAVRI